MISIGDFDEDDEVGIEVFETGVGDVVRAAPPATPTACAVTGIAAVPVMIVVDPVKITTLTRASEAFCDKVAPAFKTA